MGCCGGHQNHGSHGSHDKEPGQQNDTQGLDSSTQPAGSGPSPTRPHGSSPLTTATLVRTAALGLVMGLLAALAPLWRISRLDPAAVLRGS